MILITGATGFLGKNMVPALAKYSRLRILARRTSNIEFFQDIPNIEIVFGDIEKNTGIIDGLKNIDMVIHAAARTMGRNYLEYHQTNVIGTLNTVRAMEQAKVKKILLLSSHAACGPSSDKTPLNELARPQPISLYGRTKLAAENIVLKSTLKYIILRPVSVFGPHDMDVLRYVRFITQGISPVSGCGKKYLNLIYVEDLVQSIVQIVKKNEFNNHTYFVNDGMEYELHDILNRIANLLHKKTRQVCIPEPVAMVYGLINDVFLPARKRVVWRDKIRELTQKYWLCSNEKIADEYAFRASFTLDQALRKTMKWYQNKGFLG
jgi:nucleoside-diphosphate-sugar epimerase